MVPIRPNIATLKPYVPGILEPGKIKLASNENPLGASPRALEAVRVSLGSMHLYPDGAAASLRRSLSRHWQLDESWFVPGNGSDEILQLAAEAFVRPGEQVLIADHTFSVYSAVSTLVDAEITIVPLEQGSFVLDRFLAAITPKTRIIFLCSPNNPTGTIITRKDMEAFLAKVPAHVLVILDEAYAEFVASPDFPDSRQLIRHNPNLLVTRTFSKLYGLAGMRIGYGMAQPELIANLQRPRPPFNVNILAQAAAVAALEDTDYQRASLKLNTEGRLFLTEECRKLGLKVLESHANFICVETFRDSKAMYNAISAGGVTIRPLASFSLPTCIRITVGTAAQNGILLQALETALKTVPVSSVEPYLS